ncbi:MAG: hypothetical protein ACM3ZT_03670 [Bacillota bacterium]
MTISKMAPGRALLVSLLSLAGAFHLAAASAATVASITLAVPTKTLTAGNTETLKATAKDSSGHVISGVAFTWTSSSTKVLTISSAGLAKGLFPGSSTVKVTGGGKTASVTLSVVVASVTLTAPSKTLKVGSHETLKAVAKNSAGQVITGVTFKWTSSHSTIVSVGSTGVATALTSGSATLKASVGPKSASVVITVPPHVAGIAAKGSAIAGATVTLVDKNGATISTVTGSDGSYSLDTTGLTPPFMVSVQVDPKTVLYSVSDTANPGMVINVTPLTDLIIRSWYSVQGLDVATAFAAPVTDPPPSPTDVQIISNVVVQVTALWLQQNGVDTTSFSPISTAFTANGTGADAVLDDTTVDTGTGAITISAGTVSQSSTVTYDTGTSSMNVATTTTDSSTSTTDSSVQGTVVATSSDAQTALTAITTTLNSFASTVNTKGSALAASDVKPFLDTGLLNEGLDQDLFADNIADNFNGTQTGGTPVSVSFQVLNIQTLDTVNGLADVNFIMTETAGNQTQTQTDEFFFKDQGNGTWLFYGDNRPAKLSVAAEVRTNQGTNNAANGPDINLDVRPLTGLYSGITANGGPISNQAFTQQGTEDDVYIPDPAVPATTVTVTRDVFFYNTGVLGSLPSPGTSLTITLTPVSGPAQPYTVLTNAVTNEGISITSPTGSTLATATLGTPLHVVWTLPKTFAVAEVKLEGFAETDPGQNDNIQCNAPKPVLSNTATSGDITIPTTCGGKSVLGAILNVNVIGVNGEREIIDYEFQN